MLAIDGGGGGSITNTAPPACIVSDPKVEQAAKQTIASTEFGQPTDGGQAAYQIKETLARTDLSQDQKDEYLAAMVQMAGGQSTFCGGSIDERTADKIQHGLNDIGSAWTDPATPELRDQVKAGIARGVADGRLDADDLYGLVSAPGSHGARELLSEVRDGTALASVSHRLISDAQRQGYDINDYQTGPQTLTAAADIANMAAAGGNRSAANEVLAEITRVEAKGAVAGDDMTLTQAMMATTVGGGQWSNLYQRDGFHALSGLLNSVTQSQANQPAQDKLFAGLVRSGGEGYVGGIEEGGDRGPALDQLGSYFDRNVSRLTETDWRMDNTGDFHHDLVQDFARDVMLDKDYGRLDQTQNALTDEMTRLAVIVGDTKAPRDARETAASTLGTVMGSLEKAGTDYIAHAEGDAEAKVAFVRQFTDIVTDKLIGKLGAKLPEGPIKDGATEAGGNFVDQLWQKLVDHEKQAAVGEVNEATGGVVELAQTIRATMATGETNLLTAFDARHHFYYGE